MFDLLTNQIEKDKSTKSIVQEAKSLIDKIEPNAFYMAIVTNTNDSYKLGRVQIRIPAIHGAITSENSYLPNSALPWARPALFSGFAEDMGQFIIPPKGARVFVTFEYNDISKPIYFGGIPMLKGSNKTLNDNENIFYGAEQEVSNDDRIKDLKDNSAQYVLFKSLKGTTIIIDDTDESESIKIIDALGQKIEMKNESNLSIPRRGNRENALVEGSISIESSGTLNLKCKNLNIEAETSNIKDFID